MISQIPVDANDGRAKSKLEQLLDTTGLGFKDSDFDKQRAEQEVKKKEGTCHS